MPRYRNRMLAFMLNFIPGLGHLYWGRKVRGILYPLFFFGGLMLGFLVAVASNDGGFMLAAAICAFVLWCISMLDITITLLRAPAADLSSYPYESTRKGEADAERFYTILLSFVPGLGHFQLGLMQRGLSFLISFFGLITIMFVITGLTNETVFLLFLGLLPIIWLYCMFDAVQLVHRKQAGELLVDRTLFDEWESGRGEGKRSKVLATLLSAFPGAGQMYLGMQKRGLQLMVLFLGSFYIIDVLRLSLFLFIVPVIWFYSFFDGLQATSRYDHIPLEDRPLFDWKGDNQNWIGLILLLLGIYYVTMSLIVPIFNRFLPEFRIEYFIDTYLRPVIVSLVLIGGGFKLLSRSKNKGSRYDDY
ncbi:hypothetical protein [Paenibacillus lentus]|uniref:Multi-TM2 domain-containing protein n=1 Tax=Paenibacillus lentus TaxID=1338368 RepID=A0A3S8RW60_9BACL|nr:hypothetical protein [Paenibacillus lentus]AZK47218.1 hypothetical protein EIM92_14495 [Paenibacillus lentus]